MAENCRRTCQRVLLSVAPGSLYCFVRAVQNGIDISLSLQSSGALRNYIKKLYVSELQPKPPVDLPPIPSQASGGLPACLAAAARAARLHFGQMGVAHGRPIGDLVFDSRLPYKLVSPQKGSPLPGRWEIEVFSLCWSVLGSCSVRPNKGSMWPRWQRDVCLPGFTDPGRVS